MLARGAEIAAAMTLNSQRRSNFNVVKRCSSYKCRGFAHFPPLAREGAGKEWRGLLSLSLSSRTPNTLLLRIQLNTHKTHPLSSLPDAELCEDGVQHRLGVDAEFVKNQR